MFKLGLVLIKKIFNRFLQKLEVIEINQLIFCSQSEF